MGGRDTGHLPASPPEMLLLSFTAASPPEFRLSRLSSWGRALLLPPSPTSVSKAILCFPPSPSPLPLRWPARSDPRSHPTHRCDRCFVGACAPSTRRPHALPPTHKRQQAAPTPPPPLSHIPGAKWGRRHHRRRAQCFGLALIFPLRELRSSVDDASSQSAPLSSPLQSARRSMLPP